MIVEGKGLVAPSRKVMSLPEDIVRLVNCRARDIATKNVWNIDNVRLGLLGEAAVGSFFMDEIGSIKINYDLLPGGDDGVDGEYLGNLIQIKTRGNVEKPCWVKIVGNGNTIPLKADYYIFVHMIETDQLGIDGYCNLFKLEKYGSVINKAYSGKKMSFIELEKEHLNPIDRLVKKFKAMKIIREGFRGVNSLSR